MSGRKSLIREASRHRAMASAKQVLEGSGSWLEQAALAERMRGSSYSTM
jgi:hypothetical protein